VPSFWYIIHINLLVPSDSHHSHNNAIPVSSGICIMVLPSQMYILSSCLVHRDLSVKLKQNWMSLPEIMGERAPHTVHGLNNTNTSPSDTENFPGYCALFNCHSWDLSFKCNQNWTCSPQTMEERETHAVHWLNITNTSSDTANSLDPVHDPPVKIYLQQILIIHSYSILMYKGRQTLSK